MLYLVPAWQLMCQGKYFEALVSPVLCSEAAVLWVSQEFPGAVDGAVTCT